MRCYERERETGERWVCKWFLIIRRRNCFHQRKPKVWRGGGKFEKGKVFKALAKTRTRLLLIAYSTSSKLFNLMIWNCRTLIYGAMTVNTNVYLCLIYLNQKTRLVSVSWHSNFTYCSLSDLKAQWRFQRENVFGNVFVKIALMCFNRESDSAFGFQITPRELLISKKCKRM